MLEALIVSQLLTWIVVIVLVLVVVALARQIGVVHERVAPMGALMTDRGPEIGEMAPKLETMSISEQVVTIGGVQPRGRGQLLLFVSPNCPVCKKVLPVAKSFATGERLSVVLVGDGELAEQKKLIDAFALQEMAYVSSPHVGMTFRVGKLPYAVLIDEDGVIRAKGLVNSREHLESLVLARETGYGSIQAYLKTNTQVLAAGRRGNGAS